ncbi:MAG: signal peptidase II [Gammaproteobacteria bacterium]
MLKWLWLTALVITLDQASKQAALEFLIPHNPNNFLPFFNFTLTFNKGAAFSFLSNAGGWQRWFFTALAIGVSIFIFLWLKKLSSKEKLLACSLSLILGGAVGNVIDRSIYGHVIDFIDWFYPSHEGCLPFFFQINQVTCHWPTFNIADSAILLGATLMIIQAVFTKEETK